MTHAEPPTAYRWDQVGYGSGECRWREVCEMPVRAGQRPGTRVVMLSLAVVTVGSAATAVVAGWTG